MGHLQADRKNVQSTKTVQPNTAKRTNGFCVKTIELTGKLHSDQTGRFPVMSSKGTKHIMVICDHDSNAIPAKPLKTKSSTEHLQHIKDVHQHLNARGMRPRIHVLDNECSKLVKDCTKSEKKIDLLIVPPYLHRVNVAEKAINIFKVHFITGLAAADPNFPLHLW